MKIFKKKLWETLCIVFAALMVVFIVLSHAGAILGGQINEILGLSANETIDDGDGSQKISYEKFKTADEVEEYYRQVNLDMEGEGLVLLKNENSALPLAKGAGVSLFLSGSASPMYATHGPGANPAIEGKVNLKTALEEDAGFKVNPELYSYYEGPGASARGQDLSDPANPIFKTNEKAWSSLPAALQTATAYAQYGDAAIVTVTRMSGEGTDVSASGSDGLDGSYLSLTAEEISVLEAVAEMKASGAFSKIVVLINSAVTVQCDFLFDERYDIDAAMWIGLPGGTGMRAVARALVGDIVPSGRLSDTFLKDNFAAPSAAYWKVNEGFASAYANAGELGLNPTQTYYGVYVENIYVGYRYFETRYEDVVTQRANVGNYNYDDAVAYPFGYGLSYTTFAYSNFAVSDADENGDHTVSVTVTNTGSVAGKEVVQIYLQKPYTEYDETFGIEKASVELAGFAKTAVLAPGATETVQVKVNREMFRTYDAEVAQTYILEAGDYYLTAAKDAHDAINNILLNKSRNGKATVNANNMSGAGNADLAAVALTQEKTDAEIFSKSSEEAAATTEGNAEIRNRLDFLDPNRYDGVENTTEGSNGEVTYVSRFDWAGTFPQAKTVLRLTENGIVKYDITSNKDIVEDENAETHEQGVNTGLTLAMMRGLEFDDPKWEQLLDTMTEEELWNLLTDCYGYTPAVESISKPLTDEDDGPYGVSHSTKGYSSMSCEGIIASTFNTELYEKVGEAIAADARSENDSGLIMTLHGLYAPGLNIHRAAFGGRAAEYFSEDPILSGYAAMYEIQAMQKQGIIAHVKHFIFNDEESQRNGIGIWLNEQAAREIYLLPWEYALRPSRGNAHAIMTSFNRAGCIWTSGSDDLMMGILREEWGFDGYALTDMCGSNGSLYMTRLDGFMNGTDLFLDHSAQVANSWQSSPTFQSRLRDAAHRLLYIVANYSAAMDGYSATTRTVTKMVWWEYVIEIPLIVFSVGTAVSFAMYVASEVIEKKKKNRS